MNPQTFSDSEDGGGLLSHHQTWWTIWLKRRVSLYWKQTFFEAQFHQQLSLHSFYLQSKGAFWSINAYYNRAQLCVSGIWKKKVDINIIFKEVLPPVGCSSMKYILTQESLGSQEKCSMKGLGTYQNHKQFHYASISYLDCAHYFW